MEGFMQNWRDYLYAIWLASATATVFNAGLFDIRWWLVVAPTVALVTIFNEKRGDYY